jgi:hypothetical protein
MQSQGTHPTLGGWGERNPPPGSCCLFPSRLIRPRQSTVRPKGQRRFTRLSVRTRALRGEFMVGTEWDPRSPLNDGPDAGRAKCGFSTVLERAGDRKCQRRQ